MPFSDGGDSTGKLRAVAFHDSVERDEYLASGEPLTGPYTLLCPMCNRPFTAYLSKEDESRNVEYALWLQSKIAKCCENGSHPIKIVELFSNV